MKRLKILIPVLTLIGCVVGWIAERIAQRDEESRPVHAQSNVGLSPLAGAPRDQSIDGRVIASFDVPVPDAMVWLRSDNEPHWTYTDAEGKFHLDGLTAGPWPATVVARGFAPIKLVLQATPGVQDIELGPPTGPLPEFDRIERTTLKGRLIAMLERELEGYEVWLTPIRDESTAAGGIARRAVAVNDGSFSFEELDHGTYAVQVLPPWARGGSWPDMLRPLTAASTHTIVHGTGTATDGVALTLSSGEIEGVLTSREGIALEGALVLISPADDSSRVWPPISSGPDGRFRARDLPAGSYRITVRAGAASAEQTVEIASGRARTVEFAPLNVRE